MPDTLDTVVLKRPLQAIVKFPPKDRIQRLIDQRGLPATRHSRDTYKGPERYLHRDIFKVMAYRTLQYNLMPIAFATLKRDVNLSLSAQISPGKPPGFCDFTGRTGCHHPASMYPCTRPQINQV